MLFQFFACIRTASAGRGQYISFIDAPEDRVQIIAVEEAVTLIGVQLKVFGMKGDL